MHLFCFGLGYSALALVSKLQQAGWRVSGTVRSHEKARALEARNITVIPFDGDDDAVDMTVIYNKLNLLFPSVDAVLSSIPPHKVDGDRVLKYFAPLIEKYSMDNGNLRWIGYLSTTGVYGDKEGAWVDEESVTTPTNLRSKARMQAEQEWLKLIRPAHIFRLAGIYGEGRNALLSVLAGTARRIYKKNQLFSRIHVDDIAEILQKSIEHPNDGRIYNLCDDLPCKPEAVIEYACDLLKKPYPPLIPIHQATLSAMAYSFYNDNKCVKNNRIKDELGVKLHYPTYREGLNDLYKKLM